MPNLHVAGDLPDFVQDHYTDNVIPTPRGLELPDFAVRGVTDNIPDIGDTNFPKTGYSNLVTGDSVEGNESYHSDFDDNSDTEDSIPQQAGLVNSLPDFLSDAAVSSTKNCDSVSGNIPVLSQDSRFPNAQSEDYKELQRVNVLTFSVLIF